MEDNQKVHNDLKKAPMFFCEAMTELKIPHASHLCDELIKQLKETRRKFVKH